MAIDFVELSSTIDDIFNEQGLYSSVSFTDPDLTYSAYDPISGTYANNPTTYSFKAVLADISKDNKADSDFAVDIQIEVLPRNIMFTPAVDQIYEVNGLRYQVAYVRVAPQDMLYSIGLRRK